MKEFTKAIKKKGWKLKEIAVRWGLTARRLSQIAAEPSALHLDALSGLPGNPDDPYNFDDFEELFASKSPVDVSSMILAAAIKHKWTDKQILDLADSIISAIRLAEATRMLNKNILVKIVKK